MRLMTRFLIYPLFFFVIYQANAQNYNTVANGAWNNPFTWSSTGSLGIPTSTSGTITVSNAVNIPSGYSVSVDQVIISATLTVDVGGQLTLADGVLVDLALTPGSSFIVNGEFIRSNLTTLTQDVASTTNFGAGSIYRHRYLNTEIPPPLATWDAASNFILEGFTNTTLLNLTSSAWNQSYGNFTYNCIGQRQIVSFNGLLRTIQGNLSFSSTGNNLTRLSDDEIGIPITVAGNFTISGTARVNFSENGTGSSITLGGNFIHTSTSSVGSLLTNTGSFTVNVNGDFSMNAGIGKLFMTGSGGATGVSTLNLYKNFSLLSGTMSESGSSTSNGNIRFIGNGTFTFVNGGSILNLIHYYIAPTVTLDLSTYSIAAGANAKFVLDGATLIVRSLEPTGAIRNSTTLGSIKTPFALRTFNPGSTIIYRGLAPQFMGDGQPSVAGITTIVDNSQGVTLYQSLVAAVTVGGTLRLETGTLFLGTRTLNLNGTITYGTGTLGGNSSSVLAIGGTTGGSVGSLHFDAASSTVGTLTLNRTGAGGGVVVDAPLTFASQLNLTNGTLTNTAALTAANSATVTRYPTAGITGSYIGHAVGESYNLIYRTASTIGTSISFSPGVEMPGVADGTAVNDFIINTNQAADILSLTYDVFINGTVTLSKGFLQPNGFNITVRGDWNDNAGNFTAGTGVVIFDGTSVLSGTSTPAISNVQLNTGKTLTLGKAPNIAGNIDLRAGSTFNDGGFIVNLNGSALQTISANGASFFGINIIKSGGSATQLTSALNLIGVLKFNSPSANCDFVSNGYLTLISTTDAPGTATIPGTAQIYRLLSGNKVSGDVTVQRYMSGEGRIYRYLSSPVSNATVASWKDDFSITGTFTDPSPKAVVCAKTTIPNNPSLFYFQESLLGDESVGYIPYPSSGLASANPLAVGVGYAAFIRQCINPTVIDVTGPVNQGLVTFGITYTNDPINPSATGYNLIGNPYPCTISWNTGWVKTRISPIISVTDNSNGVMVVRYWDGTSGALNNGQIAPGQGFWVRSTGASPVLRITESAKVITPDATAEFYRYQNVSTLTLSLSDGHVKDHAFVKLRSESENTLDDWDAPKLNNESFDLYTFSDDNIPMAINSRKAIDKSYVIRVGIKDLEQGKYTLALEEFTGDFGDHQYGLIDNYTKQRMILDKSFSFVVDNNPLSSDKARFVIVIDPNQEFLTNVDNVLVYPNPVERYLYMRGAGITPQNVFITDNIGRAQQVKIQCNADGAEVDMQDYGSGIYYIRLKNKGAHNYKIIKK